MKSNLTLLGALIAAGAITAFAVHAQDKAAAPAGDAKPAPKLEDLLPDPVIAKGKGFEIKRSELDAQVSNIKAQAAAANQPISPAQVPLIEHDLLDQLIQTHLLVSVATPEQTAKGKEMADDRIKEIHKQMPSQEALDMKLKAMGMDEAKLRKQLEEGSIATEVLRSKTTVTDADVKKFYDDNPSRFEQPEMVRASHILISTKDASGNDLPDDKKKAKLKQIEDLLKRARDGEDFAAMAKQYSEDPGSKDKGGEYTFPRGQMVPEFEAAAFSLKTNQISDVVTTSYGYHIIKLSEKIPAHRVEFSTVSTKIRSFLEGQQARKIMPELYAQMKKDGNVEILDADLKAAEEAGDKQAADAKTGAGLLTPPASAK